MGERSGKNITAFYYIIFILKAQSVVLFKRFVNFAVRQGMHLPQKKKTCYLPQCLAVSKQLRALEPVFAALIDVLLSPLLWVFFTSTTFVHLFFYSYSVLFLAAQQQGGVVFYFLPFSFADLEPWSIWKPKLHCRICGAFPSYPTFLISPDSTRVIHTGRWSPLAPWCLSNWCIVHNDSQ